MAEDGNDGLVDDDSSQDDSNAEGGGEDNGEDRSDSDADKQNLSKKVEQLGYQVANFDKKFDEFMQAQRASDDGDGDDSDVFDLSGLEDVEDSGVKKQLSTFAEMLKEMNSKLDKKRDDGIYDRLDSVEDRLIAESFDNEHPELAGRFNELRETSLEKFERVAVGIEDRNVRRRLWSAISDGVVAEAMASAKTKPDEPSKPTKKSTRGTKTVTKSSNTDDKGGKPDDDPFNIEDELIDGLVADDD